MTSATLASALPRAFTLLASLMTSACLSTPPPPACTLRETDRAWVDRAVEAWQFTSREITGIRPVPHFQAIIFSEDCVVRSMDALGSTTPGDVTWIATSHEGTILLPDGSEMPAGVTSFVSGDEGQRYLVMSTPGVWHEAGVGEGAGQWTGYQWLIHPHGGESPEGVIERFTRGRKWSQTEGFAVVMALDRLAGPGWKRHAFGDGELTVLEMLDGVLEPGADANLQ